MNSPLERAAAVASLLMLGGCQVLPSRCAGAEQSRAQLEERLAVANTENRNLRRQLDEAQAKIRALAAIERSLDAPAPRQEGRP